MGTILSLIILSFVFVGVGDYMQSSGKARYVAKLDDEKITQQEFDEALIRQRDRLREMLGEKFDPAILNSPAARKSVLDMMINQRLLTREIERGRYTVSEQQLASAIAAIPEFQEKGEFSPQRYEALLRRQNLTPATFESNLKLDLSVQQLERSVTDTALLPQAALVQIVNLSEQQREVSLATLRPQDFLNKVQIAPAEVKAYYESNRQKFTLPEQVRIEYLVLSVDELIKNVAVTEAEILENYQANASRYRTLEERRARHILLSASPKASAEEKAKARQRAEELYKEAQRDPGKFAELGKTQSQDPGSAAQGGDLGFVPRGALVPAFEQALFNMKTGEIKGPVETEFGFHIIKLEEIKPATERPLADVRAEITEQLKQAAARRKFNDSAETFGNMVYEQADNLKGAADALSLQVHTSPWLTRQGGELPLLNNPKLLEAIFSADVLKDKRNTEAIEVKPGVLVSARVVDYRPARQRTLEEVSPEILQRLRYAAAQKLAQKQGQEQLDALKKGGASKVAWSKPQLISRSAVRGLSESAVRQVFQARAETLPAYTGNEEGDGSYTLIRITKVIPPDLNDAAKIQAYKERARNLLARAQFDAYLESLRQQTKIEIIKENLEKAEE